MFAAALHSVITLRLQTFEELPNDRVHLLLWPQVMTVVHQCVQTPDEQVHVDGFRENVLPTRRIQPARFPAAALECLLVPDAKH